MVNPNCLKSRKCNFSIAHDINSEGIKYYNGFETLADIKEHIDNKVDNNYYEQITTDTPKIYFDIDFDTEDTPTKYKYMSIEIFDDFIDELIKTINEELKLNKAVVMVQVTYETINYIDYISSCHIIYKDYVMNYLKIKDLVHVINKKFNYKLDDNVYKQFQLFRFVKHSKYGKNNALEYYNEDPKTPYTFQDAFLSNINGLLLVNYNIVKTCTSTSKKADKVDNVDNVDKVDKVDIVDNRKIEVYNILDIDLFIDDLHIDFWNSRDWQMVTKILIKKETVYNINDWAIVSSEKSNNKYTVEQNIKYIEDWKKDDKTKDTMSGLPKLTKTFNLYLPYKLVYQPLLNIDNLFDFIKTIEPTADINKIKDDFKNGINILHSDKITYSRQDGFLKVKDKVYNYFYDYLIDRNQKMKYDYTIDKIDDIKILELLTDFLTNDKKVFVISGSWGVGKTHHIIKKFLEMVSNSKSCCMVTPNNALNIEITNKLNNYNFQPWTSHTEKRTKNKDRVANENINLVCSLESVHRLENLGQIGYGILDEFTSTINHFEADTTNLKDFQKYNTFKTFERVLNKVDKLIVLDANITAEHIDLLKQIINTDKIISIHINEYKFNDVQHIFYNQSKMINKQMNDDLKNNKKIVITTNSKNKTFQYMELLQSQKINLNKSILLINGDIIHIVKIEELTNNQNEKIIIPTTILKIKNNDIKKNEFFKKLEAHIIDYKINIFIFSPTVSMGISIDEKIFNSVYGIFCNKSLCARGCIQQIYRCRQILDKKIHIIADNYKPLIPERTLEIYKQFNLRPSQYRAEQLNITDNPYNTDSIYTDLRASNKKEILESNENFLEQFIKYLRHYNANIKYNIDTVKHLIMNTKELNEKIKQDKYNEFINTRLISLEQYINMYENKQNGIDFIHTILRPSDNKDYDDDDIQYITKPYKSDDEDDNIKYDVLDNEDDNLKSEMETVYKFYDWTISESEQNDILHLEYNKFNSIVRHSIKGDDNKNKVLSYGYYTYNEAVELYNVINSYEWFNLYIHKPPPQYKAIINYNKYNEEQEKEYIMYNLNMTINKNDSNSKKITETNRTGLIKEIIKILSINPDSTKIITNKQLQELLNEDLVVKLIRYSRILKLDCSKKSKSSNSNQNFKMCYMIIKSLLKIINIEMSYISKNHNTKSNAKIIIIQNQTHNFIFNQYVNNPYHRFNIINNQIVFKNVVKKDKPQILKYDKMTYKTYKQNEIIKINRNTFNELNNKLFKNIDTYKEYIPMISLEILLLKNRLTPHQENDYLFEMMTDESNKKRENEKLGDNMADSKDIIGNILNDIISNVIITDITNKIYQHKKENFQIHDVGELRQKKILKNGIQCDFMDDLEID